MLKSKNISFKVIKNDGNINKNFKIIPLKIIKTIKKDLNIINIFNYELKNFFENNTLMKLSFKIPIKIHGYINKIVQNKYIFINAWYTENSNSDAKLIGIYCGFNIIKKYFNSNNMDLDISIGDKIFIDMNISRLKKKSFETVKINNILKSEKIVLNESEYTDIITGNFLEDPVFIESDGEIYDTPVNRSTIKKLKICPFTRKNITNIIDASDIKKKIGLWKKQNPKIYNDFMKIQNDIINKEKAEFKMIEDKIRLNILDIVESFKKNKYKSEEMWYLKNDKYKNGLSYKEADILYKLFEKEKFQINGDNYLDYKINYDSNDYKTSISFKIICRCSVCLNNMFLLSNPNIRSIFSSAALSMGISNIETIIIP